MAGRSQGNLVNVYTNDPNAQGLGLEAVALPAGVSRFSIPGWAGKAGLFKPGTPQFQAGALHVILNRTYAMWADFFQADFDWQSKVNQLAVYPRAGKDFNAYYDRNALRFFYDTDSVTHQKIYTCESNDIVAHECGHAILDAHHPEYWDSLLSATAAFHEAFGDMSAILATLDDPAVRAAILAEHAGDLRASNAVTRLAEQLARGLFDAGYADSVVSADALRDAINVFNYRDPTKLPGRTTSSSRLSSESHSFSRVFSGAFYDLLVNMYEQIRQADAKITPDAALAQARHDTGHLLAQALLLVPKGDAVYRSIATALFSINSQNLGNKYFAALRKTFVGRRIVSAREADAFKSGKSKLASAPSIGVTQAKIGSELPSNLKKRLGVATSDFRLHERRGQAGERRTYHYTASHEIELKGVGMGAARGAIITVSDALSLHVNDEGELVSSQKHSAGQARAAQIHDHVAKLVARGRIYAAREGEQIQPAELIERRQPYYIAYDKRGRKLIRRAFIA